MKQYLQKFPFSGFTEYFPETFETTMSNLYWKKSVSKKKTKRINIKQIEEIEFSLHPICVVGEIKSGRAPIKSEHKNLEHSQTSHKQVKIHRK